MARNFTVNTDSNDPGSGLLKSVSDQSPIPNLVVVLGDKFKVNLFLVSPSNPSATGYDADSGSASYTPQIGVGTPGALPTGGTYTLTFNTVTTNPIAYNATAAQIATALANTDGGATFVVSGQFPTFHVQFEGSRAGNAQALIVADASQLTPRGIVDIEREQAGGGGLNEIQSIELALQPAIFQGTWTVINDATPSPIGWTSTITVLGGNLLDLFDDGNGGMKPSIQTTFEIKIVDNSGFPLTRVQVPITILNRVIDEQAAAGGAFGYGITGVYSLPNNVSAGSVAGLALAATPRAIMLTVAKPAGGLTIFACPVYSSFSPFGFSFDLSGLTNNANYKLQYTILF